LPALYGERAYCGALAATLGRFIDTRFDDLVKYMLWGFGLQSTLLIAVLARVLLK
jgi:hypothetical protein